MRSYCLQDLLPPYLETLTAKLLALLQNGQKTVQEGALTAMASVADCAKTHFINFYSQVRTHPPDSVQCLRPLLRTPQGPVGLDLFSAVVGNQQHVCVA